MNWPATGLGGDGKADPLMPRASGGGEGEYGHGELSDSIGHGELSDIIGQQSMNVSARDCVDHIPEHWVRLCSCSSFDTLVDALADITHLITPNQAGNQLEWNLVMAVCDTMGNLVTIDWEEMFNFGQDYTAAQITCLVPFCSPF